METSRTSARRRVHGICSGRLAYSYLYRWESRPTYKPLKWHGTHPWSVRLAEDNPTSAFGRSATTEPEREWRDRRWSQFNPNRAGGFKSQSNNLVYLGVAHHAAGGGCVSTCGDS